MSNVIVGPGRPERVRRQRGAAWRALPKEERRRLRRTQLAKATQASAFAEWAEARWRRANRWATFGLGCGVLGAVLELVFYHTRDGRIAGALVGEVGALMAPVARLLARARKKDLINAREFEASVAERSC